MKCISCESLSIPIICKTCQTNLLQPTLTKRQLNDDFFVYSFYSYEELQDLINTKYEFYGDSVFNILAKLSIKKFAQEFIFDRPLTAIPIDDMPTHDFSQSAILARHTQSKHIQPIYSTLRATNRVKYAGRDLEFRQKNPRKFKYSGKSHLDVILIDDIVTTGLTLLEAKKALKKHHCETAFALTLCDAKT